MADKESSDTQRILKALGHPLRRKILRKMADEGPASSCRLAKTLDEGLRNVSYHTQILAECGVVELDELKPVLGTNRRRFRRTPLPRWARARLGESR